MYIPYLICAQCGDTLDPERYDECDRYALVDGETYCAECLREYLRQELDRDPFALAEALDLPVYETRGWT